MAVRVVQRKFPAYQTKLLLHCDGNNNGTVFIDEKAHAITNKGSPITSTAQTRFGQSSLFMDGSSALFVPATADFGAATGPFSLDFWMKNNSLSAGNCIISFSDGTSPLFKFLYLLFQGTYLSALFSGATINSSTISLGSIWNHIALSHGGAGTPLYIYFNGTKVSSAGNTSNDFGSSVYCVVGARSTNGGATLQGQSNCYIDEVLFSLTDRFPNGSTFTPRQYAY